MYLIKAELGTFIQYFDTTGSINNINSWDIPYNNKEEAKQGIKWMIENNWLDLKDYKQVKFTIITINN
jgi:hypothetical protein